MIGEFWSVCWIREEEGGSFLENRGFRVSIFLLVLPFTFLFSIENSSLLCKCSTLEDVGLVLGGFLCAKADNRTDLNSSFFQPNRAPSNQSVRATSFSFFLPHY